MVTTCLLKSKSSPERLSILFPICLVYNRQLVSNQNIYNDFRWMSGDEGDRTPDLGVANAALSHLSYIPTYYLG
jgi:hypothetical protein